MDNDLNTESFVDGHTRRAVRRPGDDRWSRFVKANKRICRVYLQPRLYAFSHMTALDYWYQRATRDVPDGGALLEFGCGPNLELTRLLGNRFARRFATDVEGVEHWDIPAGVMFRKCTFDSIPFDDEQFDVVAIRSVIEHVDDPDRTFRELARVTKPGGRVVMNLPNKWDYVSVLARVCGRFKSPILKHVNKTTWEDFPVRYRCNTRRSLNRVAQRSGFVVAEFRPLPSPPSYLSFFVPLYIVGALYQFLISIFCIDMLQPSFVVLLCRAKRGCPL